MKAENMRICPVMSMMVPDYATCKKKCAWYSEASECCAVALIPKTIAAAATFLGDAKLDDNRHGNK